MPVPQADRRYTPQEAAALSGVRLQRIQNAITDGLIGRAFTRARDGRRRIDLPAVLTFAAVDRLGKVRIEPKALYKAFRKSGLPRGPVAVTEAVTIDAPRLLAPVMRKVKLYETARARIVSDPAVMGGLPVVKGTRIPCSHAPCPAKGRRDARLRSRGLSLSRPGNGGGGLSLRRGQPEARSPAAAGRRNGEVRRSSACSSTPA